MKGEEEVIATTTEYRLVRKGKKFHLQYKYWFKWIPLHFRNSNNTAPIIMESKRYAVKYLRTAIEYGKTFKGRREMRKTGISLSMIEDNAQH